MSVRLCPYKEERTKEMGNLPWPALFPCTLLLVSSFVLYKRFRSCSDPLCSFTWIVANRPLWMSDRWTWFNYKSLAHFVQCYCIRPLIFSPHSFSKGLYSFQFCTFLPFCFVVSSSCRVLIEVGLSLYLRVFGEHTLLSRGSTVSVSLKIRFYYRMYA